MHKVKDAVSKFFQPSFLFTASNETDSPKRKRSISIEETNDKQQIETTRNITTNSQITSSKSKYLHQPIRDDESQLTDDEDNNNQDVSSTGQDLKEIEQQKKRRRTTTYQLIDTTNGHHENEKTSLYPNSTDTKSSLSNHRFHHTTAGEQNSNERINRIISSTQRFNITSTSNYDPSKSPLFSIDNRKSTETTTTTNLKSNEFSANYLLASGLTDRSQLSTSNSQQSSATLTHPVNNKNQLLSNERRMFGVNYASINSHRLSYIERLRRRTLQDCIRLNRTLDNEPLSISTIDEQKSKTNSLELNRTKVQEKECGIQCNISIVENTKESNKKLQRAFPPIDIQYEALSVPTTEKFQSSTQTDSSVQTNSSITVEKIQTPVPMIHITKPKVLGDVTPFSWPEFAHAQEQYAKKYPEKCIDTILSKSVTSTIEKSINNTNSTVCQQTNTSTNKMFKMSTPPLSSLHPVQSIWKCPSCTKEHPAQTASCSLCHGINRNYKKPSAIQSTITVAKEPTISTPAAAIINQTVNRENPVIISAPITTTPQFGIITTKENPVVTAASSTTASQFGITTIKENPLVTATSTTTTPQFSAVTTKENSIIISAPITTTSQFGIITTKENPAVTTASTVFTPQFGVVTTKESPMVTTAPITTTSQFGIMTTKENPVVTTASTAFTPQFGVVTTKESSIVTTAPITATLQFGTTTTKENPLVTASSSTTASQFGITATKENPVITPAPISTTLQFGTTTSHENPIPSNAFRSQFGIMSGVSPVVVTTENPAPNSTLPIFGTTTAPTKDSFSTTNTAPSFGTISFDKPLTTSTSNLFQFGTTSQPFSSVSSTSFTTATTSSTVPSVAAMISNIPMSSSSSSSSKRPLFGPFDSTSTIATTTTAAPVSSHQSAPVTMEPTMSNSFAATNSTLFGSSTIPPVPTTTNSFSAPSTTSSFSMPNNFISTSTASTPFQFARGGFNFVPPSTTATTQNNPQFGFASAAADAASSSKFFAPASTISSVNSNAAPMFGPTSVFGITPTSVDKSANSTNNSSFAFGFGSAPNTTTSAVPTGGFSFVPQSSSTIPTFGAVPSALPSSTPSNSFNFGATSTGSTNPPLFQAAGATSTPSLSGSIVDPPNPFNIGSNDSSKSPRPVLRAKRRQKN
ncbi:unnamed protein product [Rotaria sp. Silwood2]|nr:unnamed protein product [Rotaria sp. Silwood2]